MSLKAPPHSLEAERCVLGSMMLSKWATSVVRMSLSRDDFYLPAHALMFDAVSSLPEPDLVLVKHALGNKLADVGGTEYLIQVAQSVPSPANAEHYASVVLEFSARRAVLELSREMAQLAHAGEDGWMDQATDRANSALRALARDTASLFHDASEIDMDSYEPLGLPTSFPTVDSRLDHGGFPAGQTSVIIAGTGLGKTTLMLQSIDRALRDPYAEGSVVLVSLEMDRRAIVQRLVQMATGWDKRPRTLELAADYDEQLNRVQGSRLVVLDYSDRPKSRLTVESLCDALLTRAIDDPIAAVFVDYAQLLQVASPGKRYEDIGVISDCLRDLARTLAIPVIIGSQVTLSAGGISQTKEGRQLEEDAALVLEFRRCTEKGYEHESEIVMRKVRHGSGNVRVRVAYDEKRRMSYEVKGR